MCSCCTRRSPRYDRILDQWHSCCCFHHYKGHPCHYGTRPDLLLHNHCRYKCSTDRRLRCCCSDHILDQQHSCHYLRCCKHYLHHYGTRPDLLLHSHHQYKCSTDRRLRCCCSDHTLDQQHCCHYLRRCKHHARPINRNIQR